MAGFGLNSGNVNVHGRVNYARREPYSGLIACRICDCAFSSDKALFDHIELHLFISEAAARRELCRSHLQSSQGSLLTNRSNQNPPLSSTSQQVLQQPRLSTLNNGYASPILPRERNPFSIGTNTRNLDLQSTAPSQISARSTNNNIPLRAHPTLPAVSQIIFVPQPRLDCFTRPFLNQLETNLLVDGMASFVDREMTGTLGDQPMVDVTLKLRRDED